MTNRKLSLRQRLRFVVWEMTGGTCEWPECDRHAVELAHIHPRGMGHTGYRDTLDNVMAACWLHARVTDMEHPDAHDEWATVVAFGDSTHDARTRLANEIRFARIGFGFDMDAMQTEIDGG